MHKVSGAGDMRLNRVMNYHSMVHLVTVVSFHHRVSSLVPLEIICLPDKVVLLIYFAK